MYKKDNKEHIENYRPISLLCLVSKVMERCLFDAFEDQVYILVGSCQRGFMAKRSGVTQLVEVFDLIVACEQALLFGQAKRGAEERRACNHLS